MSRTVAQATGLLFGSFVLAALFDYAFSAGMTWLLTPEEYGTVSVAMTFFLILSFFVASGFPMSLAKFMAEEGGASRGLIRFATIGNLIVSLLVVGLFVTLTFYGPLSPGPGYGKLTILIAATTLLLSVGTVLQYALQGRMAFNSFALLHAAKSVTKLVFGAALVLLGLGAVGALSGLLVGAILIVLVAGILLDRRAKEFPEGAPLTMDEKARFLRYTGSVFLGTFALTLLMNLDLLAVKYLTAEAESNTLSAYYQSASVLSKAPLWAVIAGLNVVFPLMSRESKRDPDKANRLLAHVLRWTLLALGPYVVLLVLFPELFLYLVFPAAYLAAAPALALVAIGMGALAVCFVLARGLQATDRASAPGAFLAVSAGLQIALLFALVPRWGILGAAAATAVACIAGALLAATSAVPAFRLRATPGMVVKYAVSLALMAAVVAAMAPDGRLGILMAFTEGLLAYAVAILVLGLITKEERRGIHRALSRIGNRATVPAAEPAKEG